MKKVITYGTYDLLHYGHIKLLERAKALGDYLVVGVTSDDYDRSRGKINVTQTLMERIEAVRNTGIADEIIVEEYEGQKIDDIKRLGIDIFTVGSDWKGKFDYLNEFCKVEYLPRTEGVSSSQIRSESRSLRLGIIGDVPFAEKYVRESTHVNGLEIVRTSALEDVDAVYVVSHPSQHYADCRRALEQGKHVLCESPLALTEDQVQELFDLADSRGLVLAEGIKTAYSTAYSRMILLAKSGKIGDIVSVASTCTSLRNLSAAPLSEQWSSICSWGPTAILPILDIFGSQWSDIKLFSRIIDPALKFDAFTKGMVTYPGGVATFTVAKGVKSEGSLVISGTKGYIYVPAPWWITDYFEVRYENPAENRRYFYQLDGEGIRQELLMFGKMIEGRGYNAIPRTTSLAIARMMQTFDAQN